MDDIQPLRDEARRTALKTILVGVDGSETAEKAAAKAAQLAAQSGASLHVVTAFGNVRAESALARDADEWRSQAAQTAEAIAAESAETLRAHVPGVRISSGAAHGKPHIVLISEASRINADLIVVGNRRMQGVQRVLGSIASAVAHRAPCDVYIAHTVS